MTDISTTDGCDMRGRRNRYAHENAGSRSYDAAPTILGVPSLAKVISSVNVNHCKVNRCGTWAGSVTGGLVIQKGLTRRIPCWPWRATGGGARPATQLVNGG